MVVVLIAFAVRVAFTVLVDPVVPDIGDATAYHLLANDLAEGWGYVRPFDRLLFGRVVPTAEYPPLHPAVVALASFFGAKSVLAQRLWMCAIGAATVGLFGLLGRRVGGDAVGLVGAALAAIDPMLFQSDATLMPETTFVFLVSAALLLAHRAVERPSPARFLALGIAIGLAALTRSEGLLFALVLALPLAATARAVSVPRRIVLAALALGVPATLVGAWTLRNWVVLHDVVPLSNNLGSAIDGANCDATYAGAQEGLWLYACFGGFDLAHREVDEARRHRNHGLAYARAHLRRLPRVLAVRMLRTWGMFAIGQQVYFETLEGRNPTWQTLGVRLYWTLLPLAVVGFVLLRRRGVPVLPLACTVLVVTFATMLTYGNQRFRASFEPALVVAAAVTLVAVADRTTRGTSRAVVGSAAR